MKRSAKAKPAMIYMASNRENGKRYIGITTKQTLKRRESEHVSEALAGCNNGAFHKAIRKYGREHLEWRILEKCTTAEIGLKREIIWIAKLKPEYNSTKGGEFWAPISKETIEKLRQRHRGNKYHLGKAHSSDTRAVLRTSALQQWKDGRVADLSKVTRSTDRKVVCLDDDLIYPTASAAARFYGVSKSAVIGICLRYKRPKTAGGLVFRYFGDHFGGKSEANAVRESIYAKRRTVGVANQVGVICLDDGKKFRSLQKAAEFYGLDAVSISCVCRGIRGRKTAGGLRFSFTKDDGILEDETSSEADLSRSE